MAASGSACPPSKLQISSKPSSAPSSAQQSLPGSPAVGDHPAQRRSGGSGSFGSGSWSRQSSSPRAAQRRTHKPSKRFRIDDDAIAEASAMRPSSTRRGQTSITHLMNISLPPRASHYLDQNRSGRRFNRQNNQSWLGPIDTSRYVHANYRFVVDPANNYHAQSIDADEYVDWKCIWQILVSSLSQSAYCPICLGTPVAPRMAKCGHIFCLPCLIRYMHADDGSSTNTERRPRSKACPLCWDIIYLTDAKPVRWYAGQENEAPREGCDIVLRLVKRYTGSTLALPRDGAADVAPGQDIPWHYAAEVMDFARIMLGTVDYMCEQFDSDISALEQQEKEDEVMFGPDNLEWTRRSVRMLKDAKSAIQPASTGHPSLRPLPTGGADSSVPNNDSLVSSEVSALASPSLAGKDLTTVTDGVQSRVANSTNQTPSEYYFYQALLHYYLSPLDIRILKEAFGNFSSFPATILPRIERVSTGHLVDDELRKRAKWLGHLPRGCEVSFLECDWTDTVPLNVLEKFRPEIERRRKRKEDKDAMEERARIRAEREEDERRYAQLRRRRPGEESPTRFHRDDFVPLVPNDEAEDEDTLSSSPPWGGRSRGSAFASLADISTSPSASRTVWGTVVVPPPSPTLPAAAVETQSHDDGWLQGWEKDVVLDDVLVAEVETLSMGDGGKQASSGKKKKAKKITLMSTNTRRGA